jgi:hypothetical protein
MPTLFKNKTDDGDGTIIDWNGNDNPAGIQVEGTWDGATVTIKGSYNDGVTYKDPANAVFTEDTITDIEIATGKVKATISDAGAATSLSCYISPG